MKGFIDEYYELFKELIIIIHKPFQKYKKGEHEQLILWGQKYADNKNKRHEKWTGAQQPLWKQMQNNHPSTKY